MSSDTDTTSWIKFWYGVPYGDKMKEENLKTIRGKSIYWADFNFSPGNESADDEWRDYELKLKNLGYKVQEIECGTGPPFRKFFDVLFFDYGGLLPGCEGLLRSNCDWIIENAENHPSRSYVMVSRFTVAAMKDAMETLDKTDLHNIFMNIDSFVDYYDSIFLAGSKKS